MKQQKCPKIRQLPTSKSTHVQWWHSDKNDNFQLPNLHMFNGDTLTKMTTSNFRTFTYFQLPNLHMFNGDTLTKMTTSNFQLPTSKSSSNFQIYICSMVTLWQKWQLPTSGHLPTSNFQIYICSMVTLWQKWQLPTSGHLPTSNFQIYTCSMVRLTLTPPPIGQLWTLITLWRKGLEEWGQVFWKGLNELCPAHVIINRRHYFLIYKLHLEHFVKRKVKLDSAGMFAVPEIAQCLILGHFCCFIVEW